MAMADLEQVTRLADALSRSEKQRLVEHLSRQLETAAVRVARGEEPAEKAGGVWQSKFAASLEVAAPGEPETGSTAPQTRVAGLNAGEVWMSDDFDAELPDEFWFGEQ
jgi:class 3 adenylate cyclase